jgi:O-antigen/teichoic acid export membrane protein
MAKNYFYNLLLTIANLLFPLISFPYVSRVLGPDGIGKVQFAFSFAQYFAMIAGFGIPIYGMREIARHRNDVEGRSRVFLELVTIYIITSVSMSLLYLAAIYIQYRQGYLPGRFIYGIAGLFLHRMAVYRYGRFQVCRSQIHSF